MSDEDSHGNLAKALDEARRIVKEMDAHDQREDEDRAEKLAQAIEVPRGEEPEGSTD